ncbi:ABC transporter substrate-binding protein [Rossellomorea aquimaris]|uniref:ABC transporter substrate-binding protein n=1 Tax=Rossellomorea aquimaris TaxID=189382 RepID=A0A5D4U0J3_9BACI|nr:ABC transporter substrate-binding protein [Rossellomorea aquimaris]TYS80814.1 ABC transporter substrate-binding protein [Rossellomorea aquimaris]
MKKHPYESTWITTKEERTPLVVLEANRTYWNPSRRPKLDKVVFRNDLSAEKALHLCTTTEGEVDIVTCVKPEDAYRVIHSPFADLAAVEGKRVLAGVFNRYRKDSPFNERSVRLAFNFAVDRDAFIQQGFNGYAESTPALTPPWAFDFPEGLSPRPFDPERALYFFNKTGWPKERSLLLTAEKQYEKASMILGAQIEKVLKIKVNLDVIEQTEQTAWRRLIAEKKLVPSFDLAIVTADALFYEGTPAYFHREFFGGNGALRTGPELPEFEEIYNQMAEQTDKSSLVKFAKKVDEYVFHEALGLFLCSPYDLYAVNRHVKFKPYRTTFELAETTVSRSHWSVRNY